jgi:hypothetical protein
LHKILLSNYEMEQAAALRYHKLWTTALLVFYVFLFVEGSIVDYFNHFDDCVVDRFGRDTSGVLWQMHRWTSPHIFRGAVGALFVFFFCLIFLSDNKSEIRDFYKPQFQIHWNHLFGVLYTALWYGSTYALLTASKHILADTTCGGDRINSISGHYGFFIFYIVTQPYLALLLLPLGNSTLNLKSILHPRSPLSLKLAVLSISYCIFFAAAVFTLLGTWRWGYHSPRQIVYGSIFGLLSHKMLAYVFENFHILSASVPLSPLSSSSSSSSSASASSSSSSLSPSEGGVSTTNQPLGSIGSSTGGVSNGVLGEVVKFLQGQGLPLAVLVAFNVVSLLLSILIAREIPFTELELVLFFICWPALFYAFLIPLRGRFNTAPLNINKTD